MFTTKKVYSKIALNTCTFWEKKILMNNIGTGYFVFDLTEILISKKYENEIVFKSSVLAWIRSWIRIRIESIRIHNPGVKHNDTGTNRMVAYNCYDQNLTKQYTKGESNKRY
jgi:hypothetical protein